MRDWLPADDLVWLVLDAVEQCDLSAFTAAYRSDGQGRPAYDPALMVALLLFAYCHGVRSSREIERRCQRDVAFRVIGGGHRPDHATIARFRERHEAALATVFTEVLRLCAEAGMLRLALLAIDGTKVAANASWSANRTEEQLTTELAAELAAVSEAMLAEAGAVDAAEDAEHGRDRGDELPPQLQSRAGRIARLTEARDRLATERQGVVDAQQAKIDAWQARKDSGKPRPGARPGPIPPQVLTSAGKAPRANSTDPQARTVKTKHTLLVGYNAQAVVTADQVIVGATVMQKEVDRNLLHPVLDVTREQLTAAGVRAKLNTVVADSGYVTEEAFALAHEHKIRLLAPLAKDTRKMRDGGDPAGGQDLQRRPETARGQRRLRHHRGRADYRQRGRTVEPVFGQLKTRQNMTRFSRRGHTAVTSEWHLACAAHNLLKLHAHNKRE
ncbi:MAG: transposase [Mycobacteriales bacterium]|nr:transposase [Mycobacteriales bacterium]